MTLITRRSEAGASPRVGIGFHFEVFAIVQEYGERVDARIAAWGIAVHDHAEVISVEHGL